MRFFYFMSCWPAAVALKDSQFMIQSRFVRALRSQIPHQVTLDGLESPVKCRKGLPLLFQSGERSKEICTAYDTGTHANHRSLELATDIGYPIDTISESQAEFQLPNGSIIKAIGRITAEVQFVRGPMHNTDKLMCQFNVSNKLAVPVLMGSTFLQETGTNTRYTSRPIDLPPTWKRSFRLRAVGNATNQVACRVNGEDVLDNADIGSEIALVSAAYAAKHGLLQKYSCEELDLADGTIVHTSGFSDVKFTVKPSEKPPVPYELAGHIMSRFPKPIFRKVRAHVLKSFQFDMILDEDIVDDFKIFQSGVSTLLSALADSVASLATIVHLKSTEQNIAQAAGKVKSWASSAFSGKKSTTAKPGSNSEPSLSLSVTR